MFLSAPGDYDGLAREADLLHKTLGIEAYAVQRSAQRELIGTDYYHGGNVRMDIGGLHPAKFHAEMLRLAAHPPVDLGPLLLGLGLFLRGVFFLGVERFEKRGEVVSLP